MMYFLVVHVCLRQLIFKSKMQIGISGVGREMRAEQKVSQVKVLCFKLQLLNQVDVLMRSLEEVDVSQ